MTFPIRFEPRMLPALFVSGTLMMFAISMVLKQWWAYRRLSNNYKVDEPTYQHTVRQIHRRLSIGGLMFGIGGLIALGDQSEEFFSVNPGLFFAFWVGVLLLLLAMVIIAVIDLALTVAFAGVSRVRLGAERRAIEEDLRRYRAERLSRAAQDPGVN